MRESSIEKRVCEYARSKSWSTYKFNSPSCAGVPDRIFLKDGQTIYIEFKAKGKKLTPLQQKILEDIRAHGCKAYVVDNVEYGKEVLDGI